MPRFSNSGPAVERWSRETGEGSSNVDLCAKCAKHIGIDEAFDDPYGHGEPKGVLEISDGFVPDYGDEDYDCNFCGNHLTSED